MKIALINENSQAAKNEMIYNTLKKVVEPMGHEVYNYGMYGGREEQAMMTTLAGLVVVLMMMVQEISDLFNLIKVLFDF